MKWKSHISESLELELGCIVRVFGKIHVYQNRREISTKYIRTSFDLPRLDNSIQIHLTIVDVESDPYIEIQHWLESIKLHSEVYSLQFAPHEEHEITVLP